MSKLEFLIRAETPLCQLEQTLGNHGILMRRKQRLRDGSISELPIITADAMRHGLREIGAMLCLDAAGLTQREGGPQLTEPALRLLFTGGMLTGRGDASVLKIERWRELADVLPIVSIMGGCADGSMIPGKLHVQDLRLVCAESMHLFPSWVSEEERNPQMSADFIEHAQRVRFDVTRDPRKNHLLSDGGRSKIEQRLLAKEAAHEIGEHGDADRGRPMPHTFEAVAMGSLWFWEVYHTGLSELESQTLMMSLALFFETWRIGGKRGTGHGKISCLKARNVELPRFERVESDAAITLGPSASFRQAMIARADRLTALLQKVDA